LPIKLHAEQLSLLGGAALAARFNALSADHLEYLDEHGVTAMAESGTAAVLLPGAFYTLQDYQVLPVVLHKHWDSQTGALSHQVCKPILLYGISITRPS